VPKTPKKKVRFYLRIVDGKLRSLPPLPPPGPEQAKALRYSLRREFQEFEQLSPQLKAAKNARLIRYVAFLPDSDLGDQVPEIQLERGSTLGCYHLSECTGAEMVMDLQTTLVEVLNLKAEPGINLGNLAGRMLGIHLENMNSMHDRSV
jgi:hypothetical protein